MSTQLDFELILEALCIMFGLEEKHSFSPGAPAPPVCPQLEAQAYGVRGFLPFPWHQGRLEFLGLMKAKDVCHPLVFGETFFFSFPSHIWPPGPQYSKRDPFF